MPQSMAGLLVLQEEGGRLDLAACLQAAQELGCCASAFEGAMLPICMARRTLRPLADKVRDFHCLIC